MNQEQSLHQYVADYDIFVHKLTEVTAGIELN